MVCNCTSPEVQSNYAENSHTGVSSDCVHKEKKQWFVLRATYGRAEKALGVLQTANVETYLPMHYVVKEINGKRKLVVLEGVCNIATAYIPNDFIQIIETF